MASFECSSYFSSCSTDFFEQHPVFMRNLDNVIGDVDDVSNTEAALTDFDRESEGGSRYGVDETDCHNLAQQYSTNKLSVNVVRVEAEQVFAENIVSENRLAEALQTHSVVTFIDVGSGYEDDLQWSTLPAMQSILAKYKVSPLFLEDGPIPHLSGIGVGVRSKIVFSDTVDNVVHGYHAWYSLPMRTCFWSAASSTTFIDDAPTTREHAGYSIIPLNMRLYMAYDHVKKNSVNILYPPHGTDSVATLRKFLGHPTSSDVILDPFVVHLLYLSQATIEWRKVFRNITKELTHHEQECMAMRPSSKMTRQLHSLAILVARICSEIRITADILCGLQIAHNEFYNMVLKSPDIPSRPPIYHQLQTDFRNLAETFKSRLIEVSELDRRIHMCINSQLVNLLHLQPSSHGPVRVTMI